MDILAQLREIYKQEWWHKERISDEELDKYHQKLIDDGNILYLSIGKELIGYIEFWRINYKQLGQIVCDKSWSAYCEDVTSGNVCYVNNIFIHKTFRGNKDIDRAFKKMFFDANITCDYFIWERMKKNSQTLKVFNRKEFMSTMEE